MAVESPKETCLQAFDGYSEPLIIYGDNFASMCSRCVETKLKVSKIYLIVSRSSVANTTALTQLEKVLEGRVAGVRVGLSQHTPVGECLSIMEEMRNVQADAIVTLGGGSIADAAKIIAYALSNNVTEKAQLLALPHAMGPNLGLGGETKTASIPIISITTSLSGAEYVPFAGVTDDETGIKYQFTGNCKGPRLIILSEELAITVPVRIWLAAGVRAIDHCIEALCTLRRPTKGWEEAEEAAKKCLQVMIPSLLRTKRDPSDSESRREAQLGVRYSLVPLKNRVFKGASHAIGHFLGPMGVGHGETSCVLMTATHKYNADVNAKEQAAVCEVLWAIPLVHDVFIARGLTQEKADLGDLLDAFVRELGLPRSLAEVGVTGRASLELLSRNTLKDPYAMTNPIPLETPEQVMQILSACL